MKLKLLTPLLLALTLAFSSPSFAEWVEVGSNVDGRTLCVDFKNIQKKNGYIYYWELSNYLKPNKFNHMSAKVLWEAD